MRRTKILNASEVKRISYSEAQSSYFKHCRLKNLRPQTITYYREDTDYNSLANLIMSFRVYKVIGLPLTKSYTPDVKPFVEMSMPFS